jgi:hypothetical protein
MAESTQPGIFESLQQELREYAVDLKIDGYGESAAAMERAADDLDRLHAQIEEMRKGEPVAWWNGCDKTVPNALRYLADNPRPSGGEDRYNSLHLYQLAGEIEHTASAPLFLAAPDVPEGWKLVPIGATPEMLRAGYNQMLRCMYGQADMSDADFVWDAMIDAAPDPKEGE